eukprot:scaffold54341_cov76-Cyclotella_meneghiniana.AAC.6
MAVDGVDDVIRVSRYLSYIYVPYPHFTHVRHAFHSHYWRPNSHPLAPTCTHSLAPARCVPCTITITRTLPCTKLVHPLVLARTHSHLLAPNSHLPFTEINM